jgi:hypothetical protein
MSAVPIRMRMINYELGVITESCWLVSDVISERVRRTELSRARNVRSCFEGNYTDTSYLES